MCDCSGSAADCHGRFASVRLGVASCVLAAGSSDRVAEREIPLAFACVCAAAVCDDRLRLYDSERFATGIRRVCACCRRGVAAWRVAGAASAPVSGSLLDKFGPVRPMFTAMLADLRAFASKRWLLCSRYVSSCPDPSTRWKNLDNSGVYVRADSSSGWENPDAGKHTNVPIPPVDGGFRTFKGRCAGVFLQWVEVFGL